MAIAYAGGNWMTVVWDLSSQQCLCKIPNEPHTAPRLHFSPDEKHLIGHAYEGVKVISISSGERIATHALCATYATMHPSGLLVVGDPAGKILALEPISGKSQVTLCLGEMVDNRALLEMMET